MKSANSGTPRSYLEVKGLHRLGDAVVGGRRHPITADALEEAHLSRPARRVARRSGGDRCASQGHAWGSPKAGGCQWRPSGRCFDASALATTRAAARHLLHGATRPLRRGRTSWMPTALGSVIWEFRQEASSQPGQGVAGREEGSAPRNGGLERIKPDRRFHRETAPSIGLRGDATAARHAQPLWRSIAPTANAKNHAIAPEAAAPQP